MKKNKKTTTIRVLEETKEKLSEVKGEEITYDKFIQHLLNVFLGEE